MALKYGFILPFTGTGTRTDTGVWGDEILAKACISYMLKQGLYVDTYELGDFKTEEPVDVAIHMTDMVHQSMFPKIARKHILWIQGVKTDKRDILHPGTIFEQNKGKYDKIITLSRRLADEQKIPFVPACVDMDVFHPVEAEKVYDISFIGNMIKPQELNKRYLTPMGNYKYGLFGGDMGKISHERALEVIAQSRINLHFGFRETIDWDMALGRPIQISACGGFTLMDTVPYFIELYGSSMRYTEGGADEVEAIAAILADKALQEKADLARVITKNNLSNDVVGKKLMEAIV